MGHMIKRSFEVWKKKTQQKTPHILILLQIFSFSLTWNHMGAKMSKRYSYKSQPKAFRCLPNFLLNDPHKTTFEIFEILIIEMERFFRFFFVRSR